ncbi:hypothetical protein [Sphingomonas colocasiae]|uniref:Uncharacterized protein n=1 Tax=Sphingomonas colocasiae TaxID=1848973 RepID=A0ABS7PWK9_9SPHN|nr:hypothetical protein [Sphingomonas colocasiae]MBY8825030.1 hypothetical protein [Sphingomonas colocasiae]
MSIWEPGTLKAIGLIILFGGACFFGNGIYRNLRLEAPATRIVIGAAALTASVAIFLAMIFLVPRPAETGHPAIAEAITYALSTTFATALVFGMMLILAGSVQAFKRWRHYRRNPR